jgi:hypothetical protein
MIKMPKYFNKEVIMKHLISGITIFLIGISTNLFAGLKPAPSHTVSVNVHNTCNMPITFRVDNNYGSQQSGNYTLAKAGTPNKDGQIGDTVGFFFNANNDEEFYTITYRGATCKVDYGMMRDYWFLDAYLGGCGTAPATCYIK